LALLLLPAGCEAIAYPANPPVYSTPRQPLNGFDARMAATGLSFELSGGINATLRYAPTVDSPSIQEHLNGVRITVPLDADGNELGGCGALADYSPIDDAGLPIEGSILLLLGGSCSIEKQFATVRHLKAVAWINTSETANKQAGKQAFGRETQTSSSVQAGERLTGAMSFFCLFLFIFLFFSSFLL
jgi:hypothetical protein